MILKAGYFLQKRGASRFCYTVLKQKYRPGREMPGERKENMAFGEYDLNKLEKARKLITEVYEFNYGDPSCKKETNRLFTILKKLRYVEETTHE